MNFVFRFLLVCSFLGGATTLFAQDGYYFHDDFEDGQIDDYDPATWKKGGWTGGDLDVKNGDIVISDCTGECSLGLWDGQWSRYTDVSYRVQGRVTAGDGSFSIWGRSLDERIYYAFVNTDSEMGIGDTLDGLNSRERLPISADMAIDDVVIKLDLIGDEISMSAWRADDDPVDLPVATFRDKTLTVGTVGTTLFGATDIVYRWMEVAEIVPGDVDTNDAIDVRDIDFLSIAIRDGQESNRYDVNRDGNVDGADRTMLLDDVMDVWYGDANLDGEFNSADLVAVFQVGQYEDNLVGNSTWATGDWDGDGEFGSSDFVLAFQQGGFERGPKAATIAVPEPHAIGLVLMCLFGIGSVVRNGQLCHTRNFS